jgi:hypothetical protein
VELYYAACEMIDLHNCCQQDDLQLENNLGTLDWSMQVNTTLLGMCVVDTWYAYSQCTSTKEKQKDFYSLLTKELIVNKYYSVGPRSGQCNRTKDAQEAQNQMMATNNGLLTCVYGPHITPTKRRISKGVVSKSLHQGKCRVCKKRQPLFVASAGKRMREMGSMEKRPGSAGISKGNHTFPTM